nr:MAG TPA: hypothetical protein [Caudoviricetes sp.]
MFCFIILYVVQHENYRIISKGRRCGNHGNGHKRE